MVLTKLPISPAWFVLIFILPVNSILMSIPSAPYKSISIPWVKTKTLADITLEAKCTCGETLDIIISILLVDFSSFTSLPIICIKNIVKKKNGNIIIGNTTPVINSPSRELSFSSRTILSIATGLLISANISSVMLYSFRAILLLKVFKAVLIIVILIASIPLLLYILALK